MNTPPNGSRAWTWRGDLPALFAARPELRDIFPTVAALSDGIRENA